MLMGTLGFLVFGYLLTVLIEIPILVAVFRGKYPTSETIVNGLLLTGVTYPVVVMVLPGMFPAAGSDSRLLYRVIAETFAPVAEVLFFRYLTDKPLWRSLDRDALVIVAAQRKQALCGSQRLSMNFLNAYCRLLLKQPGYGEN